MIKKNHLLNPDFLEKLDHHNEREVYAKIISLNFDENPLEEIQGVVVSGNITVDGASACRRTCSISLAAKEVNMNEFHWALNTKFRAYVGLKNFIDPDYDDIVWFEQGVFILTAFNQTHNAAGFTVSITGKDKMCLLDGSVGGHLFATHDFGSFDLISPSGIKKKEKIPIYDIVRNAIHMYANEPYRNIILNDLKDVAVELIDYKVKDRDLYIFEQDSESIDFTNPTTQMTFSGSSRAAQLFEEYDAKDGDILTPDMEHVDAYYKIIKKVTYGETAGYRKTELTYAGDLIVKAGASITSMLDQLTKMLGEYEYFYDIHGRFVFQRKRINHNIKWTSITRREGDESFYDTAANTSAVTYDFKRGLLVNSFANVPLLTNIKNDFSVWGELKTVDGIEMPIHLRYSIDKKPISYYSLSKQKMYYASGEKPTEDARYVDWRELIYQMALDYMAGYEESMETGYNSYYTDMLEFWPSLYLPERPSAIVTETKDGVTETYTHYTMSEKDYALWQDNYFWNPELFNCHVQNNEFVIEIIHPEKMLFWLEFIDDDSYLEKYSVSAIGRRSKVVSDDKVKAIFYRDTPEVMFIDPKNEDPIEGSQVNYVRMNIPSIYGNYFDISTQGKSAKEEIDNLLYTHTYFQETVTITSMPIYYLEPNTRIRVSDDHSGIDGEYIIKTLTVPLSHEGMMTITATKAEARIL